MYEISKRRVHAQPVELPLVKREVRLERVRSKVCLAFTPIHSMENNKFKVTLIRVFLFLKKVVFSFLPCYSQKAQMRFIQDFLPIRKWWLMRVQLRTQLMPMATGFIIFKFHVESWWYSSNHSRSQLTKIFRLI